MKMIKLKNKFRSNKYISSLIGNKILNKFIKLNYLI